MRRALPFLPPAAWMAAIFLFSTSLFAGPETGSVLAWLVRLIHPAATDSFLDTLNFAARKAAHLTEYAVLALLWQRALARGAGMGAGKAALASLIISALYAFTDEYHQGFVPGRTASLADVAVDSAGALAGALFAFNRKR